MKDTKTILWIHGFAGCPNNAHVKEMRKLYSEYEWESIEVDHHAKASMEKINRYIQEHDVSLVAGTSLGGFYAMCAKYDGPKLVVNPVVNPVRDLHQFLGKNTYKPGRPDCQTDFEFTKQMLAEFGELNFEKPYHVICHYTAHDQLLGDDIKRDYQNTFYFLEMIDEKILPEHFMTFKYVRYMKDVLHRIFDRGCLRERNPYTVYGINYLQMPKTIIPLLMIAHSMEKDVNWKKLLLDVENCMKEDFQDTPKTIHRDHKESVQICQGLYSTTIYEMEVWSLLNDNAFSDEDYQWQLERSGQMDCGLNRELIGLFPTKEDALDYLEMMHDDPFDTDRELYCAFIREKAMQCMMKPSDYLKEWTYQHCLLLDESIVRNYAEEENHFCGRPKEMIRFKEGDIVIVPDERDGHWGIVCGTPITREKFETAQEQLKQKIGTDTPLLFMDWTDDNYCILTNGEGFEGGHEHISAHHVLPAWRVPEFVRKTLEKGVAGVVKIP